MRYERILLYDAWEFAFPALIHRGCSVGLQGELYGRGSLRSTHPTIQIVIIPPSRPVSLWGYHKRTLMTRRMTTIAIILLPRTGAWARLRPRRPEPPVSPPVAPMRPAGNAAPAEPARLGSVSRRECHAGFYEKWATSHHGLAMQPFSPAFARANLTG